MCFPFEKVSWLSVSRYLGNVFILLALCLVQGGSVSVASAKNRLAGEASPYLQKHANNPVDWYPWGEEAFAAARSQNKPIFLSVGYSTCHWCSVMEKESFEHEDVAAVLNKSFISIKVDRERRPAVDETYMLATQLITGTGGWPNSVFLTPDLKPFYAGGYFPKESFKQLVAKIAQLWRKDEKFLRRDGTRLAGMIAKHMDRRSRARQVTATALKAAAQKILKNYDAFNGGFSTAPKFPNETNLLFLMQMAAVHGQKEALEASTHTLDAMLDGGIYDHVGGGFHRYATDNYWVVPHFEKMLYNQALIGNALLLAYRLTGKPRYARALRRTLDFVLRDMTSAKGGFYSALDADSQQGEGEYYTWTAEELVHVLTPQELKLAHKVFDITKSGNFEGRNILHFKETFAELAASLKLSGAELSQQVGRLLGKLRAVRGKRPLPHRDEKILPEWNGLMIVTLAEAGRVLEMPDYLEAARKAARFILTKMRTREGRLKRSFLNGEAALMATQADYAAMINALIALYDHTREANWLKEAQGLLKHMEKGFLDKKSGDFYMVQKKETFARIKSKADSPLPSGNALALRAYARLFRRTGQLQYQQRAEQLLAALSGTALEVPASHGATLQAGDAFLHRAPDVVQYGARGKVRLFGAYDAKAHQIRLMARIAPPWHINSAKPLEDFLIPTRVEIFRRKMEESAKELVKNARIDYPVPVVHKLSFNDNPLSLYEGDVPFIVQLPRAESGKIATGVLESHISLQACSDKICLPPEDFSFFHLIK